VGDIMVKYISDFHRALGEKRFTISVEIGPPKGSDPNKITKKAEMLKRYADAFNITDNQTAVVRIISLLATTLVQKEYLI